MPKLPAAGGPRYQRLYLQLRDAVLSGRLGAGARLPGSRTLARDLGVSRIVVLMAYEQLAAEGYISSKVGSGSRVELQSARLLRVPGKAGGGLNAAGPLSAYARRARKLGVSAAVYAGGSAAAVLMSVSNALLLELLSGVLMLMLWIAGTAHALVARPSVYPRRAPRDRGNEQAVQDAKYRRELREQARALAAQDPTLALELRIGRPELPRSYNDGGLIDVNHVPPYTLRLLPGLTDEMVERIVAVRDHQGGFVSVEELAIDADLPPAIVHQIAEYALFLS